MENAELVALAGRYKEDAESVYNTWFVDSPARLKAFRTIRRGVAEVSRSIRDGDFGNDFKGSPLETVLECITEQKQVFEGAAHAFYWKPKLRIPDIYENSHNQKTFGRFLDRCLAASSEESLLNEIAALDRCSIKGLGPAVANILYFLHPTLLPPFNTAILRGFNGLFGASKKLGSWTAYLEMRQTILRVNAELRPHLSKDLGAFAGLLFDVGMGKVVSQSNLVDVLTRERGAAEAALKRRHQQVVAERAEQSEHLKMQFLLASIGRALGYRVHVAANDRGRQYDGVPLAEMSLDALPSLGLDEEVFSTAKLIDVLWLDANVDRVTCAFEVEKSTSIYSGMLRLLDLAGSMPDPAVHFFLIAPDGREKEIQAQLRRPAFSDLGNLELRYVLFSDLCRHCAGLCTFADSYRALFKIAKGKV